MEASRAREIPKSLADGHGLARAGPESRQNVDRPLLSQSRPQM